MPHDHETIHQAARNAEEDFATLTPAELRALIGLDSQTLIEPDPEHPGHFTRINPDGTRTAGRIEGRTFVPIAP